MGNKVMVTTPGNDPGRIASGASSIRSGRSVADLVRDLEHKRLRMARIPVGSSVSALFPWMRRVNQFAIEPAGLSGPNPGLVMHQDPWATTFTNDSPKPVYITEVRITDTTGPESGVYDETYQQLFDLKMSIPPRRQIVDRWLPWGTYNTEADRFLTEPLLNFNWKLPAPYFLSRSQPFIIDVHNSLALAEYSRLAPEATLFYMVLRGWGVADGEPIDVVKAVPPFTEGPITNVNAFQSISFDEDRDRPLRDAWITEIGFGSSYLNPEGVTQEDGPPIGATLFRDVRIRPVPPEGPRWHRNEFYALRELGAQVGVPFDNGTIPDYYDPHMMIHAPVTPYILHPGEQFVIEVKLNPVGTITETHYLDAVIYGAQEGSA